MPRNTNPRTPTPLRSASPARGERATPRSPSNRWTPTLEKIRGMKAGRPRQAARAGTPRDPCGRIEWPLPRGGGNAPIAPSPAIAGTLSTPGRGPDRRTSFSPRRAQAGTAPSNGETVRPLAEVQPQPAGKAFNSSMILRICRTASTTTRSRSTPAARRIGMHRSSRPPVPASTCAPSNRA